MMAVWREELSRLAYLLACLLSAFLFLSFFGWGGEVLAPPGFGTLCKLHLFRIPALSEPRVGFSLRLCCGVPLTHCNKQSGQNLRAREPRMSCL